MTDYDAALAAWVAKVNRLAAKIDADAGCLHPSAWRDTLAPDHARFRKLAGGGPVEPAQLPLPMVMR